MAQEVFSLEQRLGRDGLTVYPDRLEIHQRAGKGDIYIPVREVTAISLGGNPYSLPFLGLNRTRTLVLRVGSKKYVIRRLTSAEAKEAQEAIAQQMGRPPERSTGTEAD